MSQVWMALPPQSLLALGSHVMPSKKERAWTRTFIPELLLQRLQETAALHEHHSQALPNTRGREAQPTTHHFAPSCGGHNRLMSLSGVQRLCPWQCVKMPSMRFSQKNCQI